MTWYKALEENNRKSAFFCPAEPKKIGTSSRGMFDFGHYIANGPLLGASGSSLYKKCRKITMVRFPSAAILAGDSFIRDGICGRTLGQLSFRHGTGDFRLSIVNEYDKTFLGNSGKTNLLYADGHADAAGAGQLYSRGGDIYSLFTSDTKPEKCGYDPRLGSLNF